MKRSLFALFICILVLMSSFACGAESADATLKVDYEYITESNTIKVDANFVNIKPKDGIITIEYGIKYDKSAVELVSFKTYFPKDWEPLLENEMVEDLTEKTKDGYIRWCFVVIAVGKGAKNDSELGIELEFKPLKEENTNISFEYADIGTEILNNGMTESLQRVSGNSVTVTVDLANPEVPVIDDNSVTVPENVSVPSEESEITPPVSADDSASVDINISLPSILSENIDNSDSANGSEVNSPSPLLWIIIGVGAFAVVAVVVFVIKSKKD